MSTSILYYGFHAHESDLIETFGVNGYIPIGAEYIKFLFIGNLTVVATRNLCKSLACEIELYLFFVKFQGFTRLQEYMLYTLILKCVGQVSHFVVIVEPVHYHRHELQCLVSHIAKRYLEELFRFGEVCPCIVRHRVCLKTDGYVKVGKHYLIARPEVERLCSHMHPLLIIIGIGRQSTQAVGIHERELEVILVEQ